MANHVTTNIVIQTTTDIITHLVNHINNGITDTTSYSDRENIMTLNLFSMLYESWPTENGEPTWPTRTYMMDVVGSKWCFLSDIEFDDDSLCLNLTSAWDAPNWFIYRLSDYINEKLVTDTSKFEMEITSEDEGYNHVSGGFANKNGCEFTCDYDPPFSYPDSDDYDDDGDFDIALDTFYQSVADHITILIHEAKLELDENL